MKKHYAKLAFVLIKAFGFFGILALGFNACNKNSQVSLDSNDKSMQVSIESSESSKSKQSPKSSQIISAYQMSDSKLQAIFANTDYMDLNDLQNTKIKNAKAKDSNNARDLAPNLTSKPQNPAQNYVENEGFKFSKHDLLLTQNLAKDQGSNHRLNAPQQKLSTKQTPQLTQTPKPPLLQLPRDFDLSAWEQRLLQIINTTSRESDATIQGICGVCLLQAYQIIAEFMQYHNSPPTSGGYFFDTAPNTDPFVSFRARHSILHDTLADIEEYYTISTRAAASVFINSMNTAMASSISMLPQHDWILFGASADSQGVENLMQRAFNESSTGSLYLAFILRFLPEREVLQGHAVVLVRSSRGFIMIPTNISNITLSALTRYATVATNTAELRTRLEARARGRTSILAALGLLEVREAPNLPFASALSFSDCTGEGDSRRGNNALPTAAMLNQCASGRCNQ